MTTLAPHAPTTQTHDSDSACNILLDVSDMLATAESVADNDGCTPAIAGVVRILARCRRDLLAVQSAFEAAKVDTRVCWADRRPVRDFPHPLVGWSE